MASPATLDFETLLAPISEAEPTGVELKENEALRKFFYSLRDARTAARDAEKLASMQENPDNTPRKPDHTPWKRVREIATDILATKSKDLWVAAWLLEAQTRLHQFAGLRDGFRLVRELVEKYWEDIHPRPDEEGISTTLAQIGGLMGQASDGALLAPIDSLPIAQDSDGNPLTNADYIIAYEAEAKSIRKSIRDDLTTKFDQATRSTPRDLFKTRMADISEAVEELRRLELVLDEKCQADGRVDGISYSKIISSLNNSLERIQRLSGETQNAPSTDKSDAPAAAESNAGAMAVPVAGNLNSREAALKTLLQVAEFFRRTEPHSPISYALEQTVRWGRMGLPELLQELITQSDARSDLFRLTGIPKPKEDD